MLFSETQTWVTDSAFRLHLPTLSDWHSAFTFRMILLGWLFSCLLACLFICFGPEQLEGV